MRSQPALPRPSVLICLGLLALLVFPFFSLAVSPNAFPNDASDTELLQNLPACREENNIYWRPTLESPANRGLTTKTLQSVELIDDVAVVLEYPSVYDVHTPLDPTQPIRAQSGGFHTDLILRDLEDYVDTELYDFVLLYSIQEVPSWIHSGARGMGSAAKNIGLWNGSYGDDAYFPHWPRLRSAPHMNSVNFIDRSSACCSNYGGTLTAFHEIAHFWSSFWNHSNLTIGPREWRPGDPIGWLAGVYAHWSWNWVDTAEGPEKMPGIMYSGPLSSKFNEFDLYAMGLTSFAEIRETAYRIYECSPPDYNACIPGKIHQVTVDDLIESLRLATADYYEGNGRRIPATDKSVAEVRILIVILRGEDEALSAKQRNLVKAMAENIPSAWSRATDHRSRMIVGSSAPATLTVVKDGTGRGTVTSAPAGINCGVDCSEQYSTTTQVTLSATAAAGSVFTGWSGACSGTGACVVTLDSDTTVRATFYSRVACSTICLNDNRFQVDVSWRTAQGTTGQAQAVPGIRSDDSAVLYFFTAANWEMLVKVLDGCSMTNHFWVFAAATTNVEYTLTVTDTMTGQSRSYFNPLGTAADSITDTMALPVCDDSIVVTPERAVKVFFLTEEGGADFAKLAGADSLPDANGAVQYLGSTTGPAYTNETCSPFQVTWNVRPECSALDFAALNRWCDDNVFKEDHAHGVRPLVTPKELLAPIR